MALVRIDPLQWISNVPRGIAAPGARDDLVRATETARSMATRYGMRRTP